jgi:hypothetical protein
MLLLYQKTFYKIKNVGLSPLNYTGYYCKPKIYLNFEYTLTSITILNYFYHFLLFILFKYRMDSARDTGKSTLLFIQKSYLSHITDY